MMLEDALKALSAAEAPAARDRLFELAVMAQIERRRFHRVLVRNAALTLTLAAILALVMPGLDWLWPTELPLGALLPNGMAPTQFVPPVINADLALGMALAVACLFLPWWRLQD
jgi:hypothetical protein